MSKRHPTLNGLLRWDHEAKTITMARSLNPPTYNARFIKQLKEDYNDYTVVTATNDWGYTYDQRKVSYY